MVGEEPVAVRFYCPECGNGLRALCADAGSVLDCHRCGVRVRVPRKPHPVETETGAPAIALGDDGREAQSGTRQLLLSLYLLVHECAFVLAAITFWILSEGVDRFLDRDPGALRWLFLAAAILFAALVTARSLVRYFGYVSWEPAAEVFTARLWLSTAKIGVMLRTLGFWLVLTPFFLGFKASETPVVVRAVAEIGILAWAVGRVFEFGVVFTWYRVLLELAGQAAARVAARYVATSLAALVGMAMVVSLAGIVVVLSLRKAEFAVRPEFSELPLPAQVSACTVVALVALFGGILFVQYARVLLRVRKSLSTAVLSEARG